LRITITPPKLTDYQKAILYSKARFTVTEASTKSGKTYSHIWWLFQKAHSPESKKGYNYWWIAPVYSQAKIAFKRMRRKVVKTGAYRVNESDLIIYCPNGSEIHFKSADHPDNLYGEDVYAAVFDEAPRAKPEAWHALRSTLSATEAPCKLIGNFGGTSNWVHQLKEKADTDSEYAYFKITCYDAVEAGILSLKEVEQAKKDLPEKIFRELYMAESSGSDGQLIDNESIRKLFTNVIPTGGVKYITADIARLGKDKTVIMVWDGLNVIDFKDIEVSKITETSEQINILRFKHNVNLNNIIVDEDGVGGGVRDILGCRGFMNNSKAIQVNNSQQNFSNLKNQCYYKLAEEINANNIRVNLPEQQKALLIEELEMVRLPGEVDTQRIALLSKENIKKIIGRSPDYSDTLMMRMFFMLNPHQGQYFIS